VARLLWDLDADGVSSSDMVARLFLGSGNGGHRSAGHSDSASIDSVLEGVGIMAAVSIRNLDEDTKRRLRIRAAQHGRSMEAEIRAILEEAVKEPERSGGLFTVLMDRFGAIGGVELDLPLRSTPPRAADLAS
jgi:antitoxin FitA